MRLLPDNPAISWTPYAYLIYALPLLLRPVFWPRFPFELGLTVLGLAAFLALYFWGWWIDGPRKLLPVTGIAIAFAGGFDIGANTAVP